MADRRPRSKVDDILEVLDVGLQGDTAQHTRCARCFRREPVEGGSFCAPCRYDLLYEDDPATAPPRPEDPLELDVVVLQTANQGVTGFAPEDDPPALFRAEVLTVEDVERLTSVLVSLAPELRSIGQQTAVLTVQLVQFIPAEFVDVAERLEDVCRTGVALGLDRGACEALIDQEIERTHRTLEGLDGLPDRARDRIYQVLGVCGCHLARQCPLHGGGPR